MEYSNLDGIEPEKLSKDELFSNITEPVDELVADDCLKYLLTIDKDMAIKAIQKVLNYPEPLKYYVDEFHRDCLFIKLSYLDEEKTIEFIKDNYKNVGCEMFESMMLAIMRYPKDKTVELRPLFAKFIEENRDNKAFWAIYSEFPIWKEYQFIKEFLDEIKKDGSTIS